MANGLFDFDLDTEGYGDGEVTQESYDPGSMPYSDLFDGKFESFNPANIVSGNNKLKSGVFDMDIEDSDLRIGYKNADSGTSPKPGRFF